MACTEVLNVEYVVKMVIGPGMSLFQRKMECFFPLFMHTDGKLHIFENQNVQAVFTGPSMPAD